MLIFVHSAQASKPPTCRSGETVYAQDGVRVLLDDRSDHVWYACGPSTTRPRRLWLVQPPYGTFAVTGRVGDKLVFEGDLWGEGGGEDTYVGWFDVRTSEVRVGQLAGSISNDLVDVVVDARGNVGVAVAFAESGVERIGYLGRSSRPGELQRELVLGTPGGPYVKGSLAFADRDGTLTWQDQEPRRAPVTGEAVTCTSGTTLAAGGGARVFEVLPAQPTETGFQADVLAACPRGATVPRELAVANVSSQAFWSGAQLQRAGTWVAFQAGYTGIGVLDEATGAVRFVQPRGVDNVRGVAVAAGGEVVFHGMRNESSAVQTFVARLTGPTATGYRGWERLATVGGDFVADDSFAVTADGRVSWQVKDGLAQSVPLAGETTIGCGVGTTLIDHDGLRVFELLRAGGKDARLMACVAGQVVPLLKAPRHGSWEVHELARADGRIALIAYADGHLAQRRVVSFGTEPGSARSFAVGHAFIRDAAVAADGRVATAVRLGKTWRISVGSRVVARTRDGLRRGSLRFSTDGHRVEWRNRHGKLRRATASLS